MKKITILMILFGVLLADTAHAELTWSFKSPAFHYGNGYSIHVLSVEQLQFNRKKERQDEAKREADLTQRELNNTT